MPTDLPTTTSSQRAPLYEDVESLLMMGFLSNPVTVNGLRLSLRSLGPGDRFLLHTRAAGTPDKQWKCWMVASSVWMVDGYCILGEPHAAPAIWKKIQALPPSALEMLFSIVQGLFARQDRAIRAVEPYTYETASRYLWRSTAGRFRPGVPGAEKLGSNHVQQMWAFYNRVEDTKQSQDAVWEGQKFVASTMSSGVKKVDQKDRQRTQQETERRQRVQDLFYYKHIGIISDDPEKKGEDPRLAGVTHANTPDELADEMRRWVQGDEDIHDQVVSAYKRAVVAQHTQQKEEQEKRAAAYREQLEHFQGPSTQLVGYTAAQLQEIVKDRSPGAPGVRFIAEGGQGGRDYLYEKYLEREPDAGLLSTQQGRVVRQGAPSLLEKVAERQLQFGRSVDDEPTE